MTSNGDLPFPEVVDSTMLGALGACERKMYWQYLRHQAIQGTAIDLHAGICYARGLEVARRSFYGAGNSEEEATVDGLAALCDAWGTVVAPEGHPKSIDRVMSAYEFYHYSYPMSSDIVRPLMTSKGPAVEFNFVLPLDYKHPITGQPILYAGRFDMLGERDNQLFIVDDKTTKTLGEHWSRQWTIRAQFTGYVWGARQFGHDIAGAIVRGVSILKTRHETQQAILHRPEWMIDDWMTMVLHRLERLERAWRRNYYEQNFDAACASYSGCPYLQLCNTNNPEPYLPIYFEHRVWNPAEVRPHD